MNLTAYFEEFQMTVFDHEEKLTTADWLEPLGNHLVHRCPKSAEEAELV